MTFLPNALFIIMCLLLCDVVISPFRNLPAGFHLDYTYSC